MAVNYYLDNIFDSGTSFPGKVSIRVPAWFRGSAKSSYEQVHGALISEPTFSSRNKWGPVLTDVSTLSDVSSMLGDNEIFSWISASTQCWKGTEPLTFTIDFYLLNYKEGLYIEEAVRSLTKLTALGRANDKLEKVKVVAHGGYAADVFKDNPSYFSNNGYERNDLKRIGRGENIIDGKENQEGTASVKIGDAPWISNLLVSRLDVTPSLVEVLDSDGSHSKPLYYRISATFTGVSPLVTTDVDNMY